MLQNLDDVLPIHGREPGADFDLAELDLLLARDEVPSLDVEAYLGELAAMAHEVRSYLRGPLSARVQGLCRYLFHEAGFRGNKRDYYDPRNSYLNQVLDRRTGIPISLSAVTMAVGRRAGLEMVGVGLPGHFIVKAVEGSQEILVDAFHGGRILSWSDCENLVRQVTGLHFEASPLTLRALPLGIIVQRMLNNLRAIYFGKEDWKRAARVMERQRQLNPHDVVLGRDLGICLLHQGQPGKAVDYLKRYLTDVPEAEDARRVRNLVCAAHRALAEWN
jgi:regulator of sirC expression with transglutaminase-like and TPR domain